MRYMFLQLHHSVLLVKEQTVKLLEQHYSMFVLYLVVEWHRASVVLLDLGIFITSHNLITSQQTNAN